LEYWVAYLGSAAPSPQGDFNNDGSVDAADYVTWRNGMEPIYNEVDYNVWRAHFGQSVAIAGLSSSVNPAIPEPSTLAYISLAMITFFASRIRRRTNLLLPQLGH
jgi:hypothetical protein